MAVRGIDPTRALGSRPPFEVPPATLAGNRATNLFLRVFAGFGLVFAKAKTGPKTTRKKQQTQKL